MGGFDRMSDGEWQSLPAMMLRLAASMPDRVVARFWRDGGWQTMRWGEFAGRVAAVAAGLRGLGVMPGDRVLLVSDNRPEFMIADNAIMAVGGVTVPTYTTNTLADHAHVLRDCSARIAIVSGDGLAARVIGAAALSGGIDTLICMEDAAALPGRHHGHALGSPGGHAGRPGRAWPPRSSRFPPAAWPA